MINKILLFKILIKINNLNNNNVNVFRKLIILIYNLNY